MHIATYRVQLHAGFTFDDAAAIAGYLADLGVSHLYCSPYLQAVAGSTHGYDVTDHSRLNAELGGRAGFDRLAGALRGAGLGQLADIVPNHMALAGQANAWWWDVLENGPSSRYAGYFDIDWDPPQRKLTATVLMPILAGQYGRVLEAGELRVERHNGSFTVRYYEHELPVSPRTLDDLLGRAAKRAGSAELAGLATELGDLPHAMLTDANAVAERHQGKEALRARLASLCAADPAAAEAIDAELAAVNGDADALDELLDRQNYRLASWSTAAEELSYRRFFDIDTLAGLRVEEPAVFRDTHRLILDLVRDGVVDGLRVDHVDGLADPEGYLARLRAATAGSYVAVEKILAGDEELPAAWPVAGTTGYDFLAKVTQLFTDQAGEAPMRACYDRFTGQQENFGQVSYAAKLQIMRAELAAELERLTAQLADLCERHRRHRDHTRRELRTTLTELIAAFGVYRGYPRAGRPVSAADRRQIAAAVWRVQRRRADLDPELIDFIGELLLLEHPGAMQEAFAVRFAQVSAPVMAKGVEDTACYRYYPLASLNEVGVDPGTFGQPPAVFHAAMTRMARQWPETMLTLGTHDTKRSADLRARIALLAEIPDAWSQAVSRWASRNAGHKRDAMPDAGAEYLLYQTLAGAWPISAGRAGAYLLKAMREAKTLTSWTDPDPAYEAALSDFTCAVLADRGFTADLEAFLACHDLIRLGRVSSLAQAALLLTCPGVPDLYQGTETWDLSLVDPDNRRPVDYAARRVLLAEVAGAAPEAVMALMDRGGPKLWLIRRLLDCRRSHPAWFAPGSGYQPLTTAGAKAEHAVAFTRQAAGGDAAGQDAAVVVVPRLVARLAGDWAGTTVQLPPGTWTSVLTGDQVPGGEVPVTELLRRFPVAVLGRQTPAGEA